MHGKGDFTYFDLERRTRSDDISLLFPGWKAGDERIAVLCPHDDDGLLGAGYAILAAQANGAQVYIFIFCNGCGGYSTVEEKDTIVEVRRKETPAAYSELGISEENIVRFDYPDFSLEPNIGWLMPWGGEGSVSANLKALRRMKITRVLVPNGYREHMDHEAACRIGAYDSPQVGDNILADWGLAPPVRSCLQYAVWGDFSPEDAIVCGRDLSLRANRAILASLQVEETIERGIRKFRSQSKVIEGLIAARKSRRNERGVLELYLAFDPRPPLNYGPYHEAIRKIT
ncbi:MAG: PIG-L deacetylase family protein [Anaerolineae bacterium]